MPVRCSFSIVTTSNKILNKFNAFFVDTALLFLCLIMQEKNFYEAAEKENCSLVKLKDHVLQLSICTTNNISTPFK